MEGSPLIFKLEVIKVSWLHETREHVLLCQLLPGLEGVNWPNLEQRERRREQEETRNRRSIHTAHHRCTEAGGGVGV